MKYYECHIGSNKLELHNSFLGKETVKLNNRIVSETFSLKGTYHFFKINSIQFLIKTTYKVIPERQFEIKLFKCRNLIDSKVEKLRINKIFQL
ncbi:hypothetical protein SAMN05444411_102127 [Lutibacter oricola]|uniref:Uncharacterized protein n=1 Tax=Lutibacter oricola TaxID=762486 RepID=A0A1H2W754_9FLAO|nr:hypothetical protein [Lutibacter oricola]SDW76410.1 hypothetical protein SAMN05444411_102127 [Lutibacter oricola]